MNSKGFKIVVGVLIALIVIVGGALVVKNLGQGGEQTPTTKEGRPIPEGAVADDPSLPLPPDGAMETLGSEGAA